MLRQWEASRQLHKLMLQVMFVNSYHNIEPGQGHAAPVTYSYADPRGEKDESIKIVIVGAPGVGKTAIAQVRTCNFRKVCKVFEYSNHQMDLRQKELVTICHLG